MLLENVRLNVRPVRTSRGIVEESQRCFLDGGNFGVGVDLLVRGSRVENHVRLEPVLLLLASMDESCLLQQTGTEKLHG